MKSVRRLFLGMLLLVGWTIGQPSVSFAHTEHIEADIKLLRDAASALQQSRPDLANALGTYADSEAKELDEMPKDTTEGEETGEQIEPKNEQNEHTKY